MKKPDHKVKSKRKKRLLRKRLREVGGRLSKSKAISLVIRTFPKTKRAIAKAAIESMSHDARENLYNNKVVPAGLITV